MESYVGDVTGFLAYLDVKGADLKGGLRRFHVTSYRSYLLDSVYESATINKKINSLQSFNKYLLDRGEKADIVVDCRFQSYLSVEFQPSVAVRSEHFQVARRFRSV